ERRLPGTRGANNRHQALGLRMEVDALEHQARAVVPEHDPLERNRTANLPACEAAAPVDKVRSRIEELKDALGTDAAPLDEPPGLQQRVEGSVERGKMGGAPHPPADGARPGAQVRRRGPEPPRRPPRHDNVDERASI